MKKVVLLALAVASTISLRAQTIAQWTFETSIPAGTASTLSVSPEVGTGTGSGVHASAATVYSSPSGNGSVHSFSANTWAVGDYWQFQTSTVGFQNIAVSYGQTSSGTGPGRLDFSYSTDGSLFTTFAASLVVQSNASPNPVWNTTTASSIYSYSFDLSAITSLNNAPTVYFRVTDSSTTSAGGGTVATGGTDRIDNFTIAVVPEPSSAVLLLGGLGILAIRRMRRNK
jgi:hypothetical protein